MKYLKIILIAEIMLAILTLGGLLGIITLKNKTEETINNLYIELDNEKEKVDILIQENNVLEELLEEEEWIKEQQDILNISVTSVV